MTSPAFSPWPNGRFRPRRPVGPPAITLALLLLTCLNLLETAGGNPAWAKEIVLRIGLGQGLPQVRLSAPHGGQLAEVNGRRWRALRPGEVLTFETQAPAPNPPASSPRRRSDKRRPSPRSPYLGKTLRFEPRGGVFEIDGRPYRGAVELRVMPAGIVVINEVGIEDYLRGVVGAEISSLSPLETLRAQAVIARTYAVANRGKHGKDGFDLCAREHCQAYGGVKAERPVIDGAVRDTRGIIMISDGVPISTLYHATCGGMTSDNEKVFGGSPTSYLRRVKCPFCKGGTNYRWRKEIRSSAILARLREEGYAASRLWRVQLDSPAPLDRVDRLTFFTDRGTIPIKGTTFRRWFDLPSTTFQLARATPTPRPNPARQPLAAATPARSHASPATPSKLSPPSGPQPQPGTELRSFSQGFALPRLRLTTLREPTPTALVVQSGAGLVRARRPPGGWMVLALAAATPEQPATDAASASGPLASPGTPSRGEPVPPPLDASGTQDLVLDRESGDPIIPLLGRGYGHQVGLCQAGAVELGRRQWSYRQILAFYYSNVALRRLQY